MPTVFRTIVALNNFIMVCITHAAKGIHISINSHSSSICPASFHTCNVPPAVHPSFINLCRVLHKVKATSGQMPPSIKTHGLMPVTPNQHWGVVSLLAVHTDSFRWKLIKKCSSCCTADTAGIPGKCLHPSHPGQRRDQGPPCLHGSPVFGSSQQPARHHHKHSSHTTTPQLFCDNCLRQIFH